MAPRHTILIQTQEMENWFLTRQITGKRSSVLFNQASLMENQPRQSFEHVQKNSILTTQFDMRQNIKLSNYMFCPWAWAYQQVILFKEICPDCPGIYFWTKVFWKKYFLGQQNVMERNRLAVQLRIMNYWYNSLYNIFSYANDIRHSFRLYTCNSIFP